MSPYRHKQLEDPPKLSRWRHFWCKRGWHKWSQHGETRRFHAMVGSSPRRQWFERCPCTTMRLMTWLPNRLGEYRRSKKKLVWGYLDFVDDVWGWYRDNSRQPSRPQSYGVDEPIAVLMGPQSRYSNLNCPPMTAPPNLWDILTRHDRLSGTTATAVADELDEIRSFDQTKNLLRYAINDDGTASYVGDRHAKAQFGPSRKDLQALAPSTRGTNKP